MPLAVTRRVRGLLATVMVAAIASSLAMPVAHAQTRLAAPADDGEALLRAIFFLEGPTSEQIPELRRMKTARAIRQVPARQREPIREFQNGVVAEIRNTTPVFFAEFGACLRGGERRAIANCLTDANALLDRVIDRSPALTTSRRNIRAAWARESGARDTSHAGVERAVAVQWPPLTYQHPQVLLFVAEEGGDLLRDDLVNSIAATLKRSR